MTQGKTRNAVTEMANFYSTAVVIVLGIHLAWILWVIFGALWTRGRSWLAAFHIASLVWGIVVETGPWPCPLTIAEDLLRQKAGNALYRGSFLAHYLSRIVYPDLSDKLLTVCGVMVCAANLAIYLRRYWIELSHRPAAR